MGGIAIGTYDEGSGSWDGNQYVNVTFYFRVQIKTINLAKVPVSGMKVEITIGSGSGSGLTDKNGIYQNPPLTTVNHTTASVQIKVTDPATGFVFYNAAQDQSNSGSYIEIPITIDRYFVVHGKVTLTDKTPLANLKIEATHKELGIGLNMRLAPAILTNDAGEYTIPFWIHDLIAQGRTKPKIVIRVFSPKDEFIVASDLVEGNGLNQIDIPISSDLYGGNSEFDRFADLIKKNVEHPLATILKDGIDAHDLAILASITGGDISQMNHYTEALRLSDTQKGVGIDAEWLYGLFRRGVSTNFSQLIQITREHFDTAINDAVELNLISNTVFTVVDKIFNQLKSFKATAALTMPEDPEMESMLGYVLSCSGLSPEQQATLYLAYIDAENKDDSFWEDAFRRNLINAAQLKTIPLYLKLTFICERERGIFETLLSQYHPTHINELATLEYDHWYAIVQKAREKNKIPGIHPDEDSRLVPRMLNRVYDFIPTAVLVYLMGKEETILDQSWHYLEDNLLQFDFRNQNINTYIDLHPETLNSYLNDVDNLRQSLNRIQRTFLLAPAAIVADAGKVYSYRPIITKALLDLNLDSAGKILRIGEVTFIKYYRDGLQLDNLSDSEKEISAGMIFQRARKQANLIRQLHSTYGTSFNNLPMYVVPQSEDRRKARVHIPGLSTLFEAQEIMSCDHCNSVLSPAAYLIDLLSFLDEAEIHREDTGAAVFNETALDILFDRRPDIRHLVLNCENTNTSVSYVDLVNEVLENAIALQLEDNESEHGIVHYRFRGKVVNTNSAGKQVPVKGAYVQLFSAGATHEQLVGSSKTDRYGKFEINVFPESEAQLTTVTKVIYEHKALAIPNERLNWDIAHAHQEQLLDIDFTNLNIESHPKELLYLKGNDIWTIRGSLKDTEGRALASYTVMAWDEDYGGDDLLGVCETDITGNFEISFHSSAYTEEAGDALPDPYIVVIKDGRILYLQYIGSNVPENVDLKNVIINVKKPRSITRTSASLRGVENVSGKVINLSGNALPGLRMVLTNEAYRPENFPSSEVFEMSTEVSDGNGNFLFWFDEREFTLRDPNNAGQYQLIVKVSDSLSWIVPAIMNNRSGSTSSPEYRIDYSGTPSTTGDRITGKLLNQYDNSPAPRYLVEAWRTDGENEYWVGNAISANTGEFIIPTRSLAGQTRITLSFRIFNVDQFLYQTAPKVFEITGAAGQKAARADVLIPYYGQNVGLNNFIIKGTVTDETTHAPLRNTWIAFWEKDKEREYAKLQFGARTDENGNFVVKFELPVEAISDKLHSWYYKVFLKDRISFDSPQSFVWSYNEPNKQMEIAVNTSSYTFGTAKEYYTIQGRLRDKENGQPLRGFTVEAWDQDENGGDDMLGIAKTDLNGDYEITFDSHYFRDMIKDNDPDIYFKVYQGINLILREDVTPDVQSKVIMKDLEAVPMERVVVSGQRGPLRGNVYKELSETLYPWNFPFNLHTAETHLYLRSMTVTMEQLIAALNPGIDTRLGQALAYLEMSREELDSLKTTSIKSLYGLPDDVPIAQLNDVPFILSTIRISFDTFRELIGTDYVNPLKKEILFLTDRTLIEFSKTEFLNLYRLSRLKTKCGWNAKELEQVIRLYENRYGVLKGSTTDEFIIYLAGFKKLMREDVTLQQLLSWQYDLNLVFSPGGESMYQTVFYPAASESGNASLSVLMLNASGESLAETELRLLNANGQLSELTSVPVITALGVEANDLQLLITHFLPDSLISIANLSHLYRVVSFCRYLGISYGLYRSYIVSIGFDPLKPADKKEFSSPETILRFRDEFDFIRTSGITFTDLKFLYASGHEFVWTEDLKKMFADLRDACLKEDGDAWSGIVTRKFSDTFDLPEEAISLFLAVEVISGEHECSVLELFTGSDWFETTVTMPDGFLYIMNWLQQWNIYIKTFLLIPEDISVVLKNGSANNWYRPLLHEFQPDKTNQDFNAWKNFIGACRLNTIYRKKDHPSLFRIISDNRDWSTEFPSATKKEIAAQQKIFFGTLAGLTGWNAEDIPFMTGTFRVWKFPENFLDMKWMEALSQDFRFLSRTGLLPTQILQLQSLALQNPDASQAEILQMALKRKTPPAQWEEKINQLKDTLRESQRSALQTWILSRNPDLQNEDDIYAKYLVDTETGTAIQTSRIRQSISSVQLLVQRIRMGLEPGISFNRENMKEWEWRKNYRVWEANRKIFLYPENWLEPELRDDKSQFFKKFEEELMQGEINAENTEKAFRNYLLAMDEAAHLEVSGFCHQEEGNIYHVVARTRNIPHKYFYRRWIDQSSWTPWEEIQLDISGDHLIPVYWNRKLILFWPMISEKADESNATPIVLTNTPAVQGAAPSLILEIKMALSHRQSEGWTTKKISEAKIKTKYKPVNTLAGDPMYPSLFFQTVTSEENFFIRAYKDNKEIGMFAFSAGTNEILAGDIASLTPIFTAAKLPAAKDLVSPLGAPAGFSFSKYTGKSVLKISDQEIISARGDFSVMAATEQTTVLKALFYEDKDKVYAMQQLAYISPGAMAGTGPSCNYRFSTFYHPHTGFLKSMLDRYGVPGLFHPPINEDGIRLLNYQRPDLSSVATFDQSFRNFSPTLQVTKPYPSEDLSFDLTDGYASYNWELFFHAPITNAIRLSQNQQFEEAQRWFHFIFDPTETEGEAPKRFWRIKPFYQFRDYSNIADIIKALDSGREEYTKQVEDWENKPFNPHVIARLRIVAYMRMVVMKYLDNMIAWGDQLFQSDTIESINEATQIYIFASQLLGRKPSFLNQEKNNDLTVEDIFDNLDNFSNALIEVESKLPNIDFRDMARPDTGTQDNANTFGSLLYFCIPQNEHLLNYWETVSDRLWKIRQGMNIEGVRRALALFEPPIDPAMLVKAGTQGVDLAAIISETNVNVSTYRFSYLLPKAIEFCNEVKSLGGSLLSAMEKRDAEEMALLRSTHEMSLLKAVKEIKKKSIEEAESSIASLNASLRSAGKRYGEYGRRIQENTTALESAHMGMTLGSLSLKYVASGIGGVAVGVSGMPNFILGMAGAFGSPVAQLSNDVGKRAVGMAANMVNSLAQALDTAGSIMGTFASWERRKEDWQLQKDLAEIEIQQVQQQLNGAYARRDSATLDLHNHEKQIAQAQEVRELMESKYTNHQLYQWMVGQLSNVYFRSYQLAFDLAKKAEKAYAYELGVEIPGRIEFGYWDSLKKGLMSGEKLQLDLRRLETEYMDQNKREFELSKHISLALFNSSALLDLREKGECEFQLPEILFDMDHPSHYMRRIKSVSLTIPCITGPYSGVHAQLTLLSSTVRTSTSLEDGYAYAGEDDKRFARDVSGIQSIATSTGQNDSGVFELNFRDERYLPFERAGAVSTWRLELPATFRQFNYDSISDVIMHLNYTAREGGEQLKEAAEKNIRDSLNAIADFFAAKGTGLQAWISMKTDFSTLYSRMLNQSENGVRETEIEITDRHFPYFLRNRVLDGKSWTILVKCKNDADFMTDTSVRFLPSAKKTVTAKTLVPYQDYDLFRQADFKADVSPVGKWKLRFESTAIEKINPDSIEDIWLVSDYNIK